MNQEAERFLRELEEALANDSHRHEILAEYRQHILEMLAEHSPAEMKTYDFLVSRLGSPKELAKMWKEEKSVTPKKMQYLFVILNIGLFVSGALFIAGFYVFDWEWLDYLFRIVTESAVLLILIYLFFWGLLGYEIGKAFGARGDRILNRTFIVCLIPNLVVVYLIIFYFLLPGLPRSVSEGSLLILTALCTGVLYPVSRLGCLWGKKASV
jgi:hypothetical protein